MGLKDWKKVAGKNDYYESEDDAVVIVYAPQLTHAKRGYLVLREKSKYPKYFESKYQALKFAKKYMRRH